MTEGISKEDVISVFDDVFNGAISLETVEAELKRKVKELDPWLPIDSAPVGKKGFLAINKDRDNIEWLLDIGEDKFYNNNSNNFTDKEHWTHYKELPPDPKD